MSKLMDSMKATMEEADSGLDAIMAEVVDNAEDVIQQKDDALITAVYGDSDDDLDDLDEDLDDEDLELLDSLGKDAVPPTVSGEEPESDDDTPVLLKDAPGIVDGSTADDASVDDAIESLMRTFECDTDGNTDDNGPAMAEASDSGDEEPNEKPDEEPVDQPDPDEGATREDLHPEEEVVDMKTDIESILDSLTEGDDGSCEDGSCDTDADDDKTENDGEIDASMADTTPDAPGDDQSTADIEKSVDNTLEALIKTMEEDGSLDPAPIPMIPTKDNPDPDNDGDDDTTPEGDTDHDFFPEHHTEPDADDFGGPSDNDEDDAPVSQNSEEAWTKLMEECEKLCDCSDNGPAMAEASDSGDEEPNEKPDEEPVDQPDPDEGATREDLHPEEETIESLLRALEEDDGGMDPDKDSDDTDVTDIDPDNDGDDDTTPEGDTDHDHGDPEESGTDTSDYDDTLESLLKAFESDDGDEEDSDDSSEKDSEDDSDDEEDSEKSEEDKDDDDDSDTDTSDYDDTLESLLKALESDNDNACSRTV